MCTLCSISWQMPWRRTVKGGHWRNSLNLLQQSEKVRTIMPSVCLHGGFWSDLDDDARSQSLLPFPFAAADSMFKVLLILTDKPASWGRLATARVSAGCGSRRKFWPPPEKPPSAGRIAASISSSYRALDAHQQAASKVLQHRKGQDCRGDP